MPMPFRFAMRQTRKVLRRAASKPIIAGIPKSRFLEPAPAPTKLKQLCASSSANWSWWPGVGSFSGQDRHPFVRSS